MMRAILLILILSTSAHAGTVNNSDIFRYLRPDATFSGNQVNHYSLDTIAKTYIGTMPTAEEFEEARPIVQQVEDDKTSAKIKKNKDAKDEIAKSPLANKTYDQIDTYIENNVTDLQSSKEMMKEMARVMLAMSKRLNWSE